MVATASPQIRVSGLTMAYGDFVIQREMSFCVNQGDIFIVMGSSGCGKSTLLRHFVGLMRPAQGDIQFQGFSLWNSSPEDRRKLTMKMGVSYQGGALFSSMTLAENIALPLAAFTRLSQQEIKEIVSLKLSLVGLAGFEGYYPAEISGGMQKRAGLARALALDPDILFFDEPSAGLDPVSSRLLDGLILHLRDNLGATFVVVTHELSSIFAIGNNSVFLDAETRSIVAQGDPKRLLAECEVPVVRRFLTRGELSGGQPGRAGA